uniref:Uncharacterized protein n=1 Tax=Trypanosoma vivax (strain Y486) TaxID=1055687 RepID=G0TVP9_TRYVY|nr:hypothetical protein, unlikely [Trypanosoma vivax Y486]
MRSEEPAHQEEKVDEKLLHPPVLCMGVAEKWSSRVPWPRALVSGQELNTIEGTARTPPHTCTTHYLHVPIGGLSFNVYASGFMSPPRCHRSTTCLSRVPFFTEKL